MPRSRLSGALSISSNAVKSAVAVPCEPSLSEKRLGDSRGKRGLAMVDVTNGADVYMRLGAVKLFLFSPSYPPVC